MSDVLAPPPPTIAASNHCGECGQHLHPHRWWHERAFVVALTLCAFVTFVPGILLPIMSIEKMGHRSTNSIYLGVKSLLSHKSYVVGSLILLFSVALPLFKMGSLILICTPFFRGAHDRLHRVLGHLGRWGMLDVGLVAIMVAWIKLGDLVTVRQEVGLYLFAASVAFSILAGQCARTHSHSPEPSSPS